MIDEVWPYFYDVFNFDYIFKVRRRCNNDHILSKYYFQTFEINLYNNESLQY